MNWNSNFIPYLIIILIIMHNFFLLIVYVSNFRNSVRVWIYMYFFYVNRVRVWIYVYFFYINCKPTFIHDDLFRDFRDKLGRDFYFCKCALSTLILINTNTTKTSLWREIFAAKKNSWFSRIFSDFRLVEWNLCSFHSRNESFYYEIFFS